MNFKFQACRITSRFTLCCSLVFIVFLFESLCFKSKVSNRPVGIADLSRMVLGKPG